MTVTQEEFKEYKRIQMSGVTNMFDINKVIFLSGGKLDKDKCFDIMDNYSKYEKDFK